MNVNSSKRIWQARGFYAAALANIAGILFFSLCFTNDAINMASPVVMSNFGMAMIIVWGLAYAATAQHARVLRALVYVFAIEKLAYVLTWVHWWFHEYAHWPALWNESPLTASFMVVYGLNDFLFMLFFVWVACTANDKEA